MNPSGNSTVAVGVEHEPARDPRMGEVSRLELEEGAAEVVVVRRLVGEAAPVLVDDEPSWLGEIEEQHPVERRAVDLLARHVDGGAPPGLAHVPERGTGGHRHPQAVAGVRRWTSWRQHRTAEEARHQLRVAFESTRGDDHRTA